MGVGSIECGRAASDLILGVGNAVGRQNLTDGDGAGVAGINRAAQDQIAGRKGLRLGGGGDARCESGQCDAGKHTTGAGAEEMIR